MGKLGEQIIRIECLNFLRFFQIKHETVDDYRMAVAGDAF